MSSIDFTVSIVSINILTSSKNEGESPPKKVMLHNQTLVA